MLKIVKTKKQKELEKEFESKELRFLELIRRGVIVSSVYALTDEVYNQVIGDSNENN